MLNSLCNRMVQNSHKKCIKTKNNKTGLVCTKRYKIVINEIQIICK